MSMDTSGLHLSQNELGRIVSTQSNTPLKIAFPLNSLVVGDANLSLFDVSFESAGNESVKFEGTSTFASFSLGAPSTPVDIDHSTLISTNGGILFTCHSLSLNGSEIVSATSFLATVDPSREGSATASVVGTAGTNVTATAGLVMFRSSKNSLLASFDISAPLRLVSSGDTLFETVALNVSGLLIIMVCRFQSL